MMKLTLAETPKTREAFVEKWNTDNIFRSKAINMGFNVVFGCVIFPDGRVAGKDIK